MYAFNITDDIAPMRRHYETVRAAGGTCVMVCINAIGFPALAQLRDYCDLPIHCHRAMIGALMRCPGLGIDFRAYQTIVRLCGADQVHVGGMNNKFYETNAEICASIDAVITSPPYPNEKDYTRTTRLESVLLGFLRSKSDLRQLKRGLVRSNTRGVYKADDDDRWVAQHPEIQQIAETIEARRIELGKTSGFERLYARVTKLYFGGMARHLADLRTILRPGACLAYVVGDQASYLRVMIPTGRLLAEIAQSLGYELVGIDLFRTRLATATKVQLREEVVVLRWQGASSSAHLLPGRVSPVTDLN